MAFKKWFKQQVAAFMLSTVNVEKAILHNDSQGMDLDIQKHQRHQQGQLMDALKHGEVTQEVKELRHRMYKTMGEMEKYKITSYERGSDGYLINSKAKKVESILNKIKIDDYDSYPLELVVQNEINILSINDVLETVGTIVNIDDMDGETGRLINITRSTISKFKIENYTKKMNVRSISNDEKLLEFYIPMYVDDYNKKTGFLIRDIKKTQDNPRQSTLIDIDYVEFITYKTIGSPDLYKYRYEIKSFDKIIEFNGYYIIKFKAKPIINGSSMVVDYELDYLNELYDEKATRFELNNKRPKY